MAFLKETGNYQQRCSVLTENNSKNGNRGNITLESLDFIPVILK